MKKITLFCLISLVSLSLTGCLGSSSKPAGAKALDGYTLYDGADFTMQVPKDWEIISDAKFRSDMPKGTVVAFRNNVRDVRFTANIAVIKNNLTEAISSLDYSKALQKKVSNDLGAYKEYSADKTKINIAGKEEDSLYLYFEGRENADSDVKRFMQFSGVKGKTAYIVTGAFLWSEGVGMEKKLDTAIKSFLVK